MPTATGRCSIRSLRVFRLDVGSAVEVSSGHNLAVDPSPVVGGRSLVVDGGLVYYRASEAARAIRVTERISVGPLGEEADGESSGLSLSGDGSFAAFSERGDGTGCGRYQRLL